jgi:Flp pilus assembly protein TadD
VRQNLALVLGLQGKFAEAETVLRRDLAPEEVAANVSAMKSLVAQPNSWQAIRSAEVKKPVKAKMRAAEAKNAE